MLVFSSKAKAGWDVSQTAARESHGLPAQVVFVWVPGPAAEYPTMAVALQDVADDGKLNQLRLLSVTKLLSDDNFQKEVFQQLEAIAPKDLKEALESAGNMHNPKMTALRPSFEKAVLTTPTVLRFKEDLARHQLEIAGASCEKFSFATTGGSKRVFGFLTLTLAGASNKAPAP
ncbi:hypothetical protein DES53_113144 [Roseimicrobium gellanilyticum]|uniref:Uncharacterized protein n=2 Tax=Roseimicrobium gellanilyticum TaxID=748857 RepID=A0A366H8R6_9BACT|nr:hypothetical protein DES53_113144 [Roseimicrobium gellanilyticum]